MQLPQTRLHPPPTANPPSISCSTPPWADGDTNPSCSPAHRHVVLFVVCSSAIRLGVLRCALGESCAKGVGVGSVEQSNPRECKCKRLCLGTKRACPFQDTGAACLGAPLLPVQCWCRHWRRRPVKRPCHAESSQRYCAPNCGPRAAPQREAAAAPGLALLCRPQPCFTTAASCLSSRALLLRVSLCPSGSNTSCHFPPASFARSHCDCTAAHSVDRPARLPGSCPGVACLIRWPWVARRRAPRRPGTCAWSPQPCAGGTPRLTAS